MLKEPKRIIAEEPRTPDYSVTFGIARRKLPTDRLIGAVAERPP